MTIKFRGLNKNWCFVEADEVVYTMINTQFPNCKEGADKYKLLEKRIKEEALMYSESVRFVNDIFDKPMVAVAHLRNKNETRIYVFGSEAYLLNTEGKTIEKLMY